MFMEEFAKTAARKSEKGIAANERATAKNEKSSFTTEASGRLRSEMAVSIV